MCIVWKTNVKNGVKKIFRVFENEENVKRYFENCGYRFTDYIGCEWILSYDGRKG